jgi:hypothetical protein
MLRKRSKLHPGKGDIDGGEGRGVPLGGHDEVPPTGYRSEAHLEGDELEHLWDDDQAADRRRDPLRQ